MCRKNAPLLHYTLGEILGKEKARLLLDKGADINAIVLGIEVRTNGGEKDYVSDSRLYYPGSLVVSVTRDNTWTTVPMAERWIKG